MGSEGGANPLRKRRETSYETVAASPSTVVLLTTPLSRTSRAKLSLPRPVSPSTVSRPFLMGVLHEAVTGRAPARMRCSSSFSSCVSVTLPDEADRRLAVTHRSVATHKIARNMDYVRGVSSRCVCLSVTGDNTSFGLVVGAPRERAEGSTGQPARGVQQTTVKDYYYTHFLKDKMAWTGRSGAARGAARQPHTRGSIYWFLLRKAITSALSVGFLKPTKAMFVPGCQTDAGGSAGVRSVPGQAARRLWAPGSEAATGRGHRLCHRLDMARYP